MAALSLAIVGKNNEPLYMREFRDDSSPFEFGPVEEGELFGLSTTSRTEEGASVVRNGGAFECSTRHQFILHAALDRYEQLAGPSPGFGWRASGVSGTDAMFIGLLCPVEDMRVYGKLSLPKSSPL